MPRRGNLTDDESKAIDKRIADGATITDIIRGWDINRNTARDLMEGTHPTQLRRAEQAAKAQARVRAFEPDFQPDGTLVPVEPVTSPNDEVGARRKLISHTALNEFARELEERSEVLLTEAGELATLAAKVRASLAS